MPISKISSPLLSEIKTVGKKLFQNNIPETADWSQEDWARWIQRNQKNIESHNYASPTNQKQLLDQIA